MEITTDTISPRALVFGLSQADGRISGEELYRIGDACGLGRERIRSCVRRLLADGTLERESAKGTARSADFHLSRRGRSALHDALARYRDAYRRDRGEPWDGRWHLVAFSLGESSRPRRDLLRDRLLALGGVRLMGGLYLSAQPWEPAVRATAERLEIESMITLSSTRDLEVGGESDPAALAARFWPLRAIDTSYRRFIERFTPTVKALERMRTDGEHLEDAVFLPAAFEMSVAFQSCFAPDPLLPRELLPIPWSGANARELLLHGRRLALALRENAKPPALFRLFDETTRDFAAPAAAEGR